MPGREQDAHREGSWHSTAPLAPGRLRGAVPLVVRITDSTTEITIDAIQPIQEILMPEFRSLYSNGAAPRLGARRCRCTRMDDQSHRPVVMVKLPKTV